MYRTFQFSENITLIFLFGFLPVRHFIYMVGLRISFPVENMRRPEQELTKLQNIVKMATSAPVEVEGIGCFEDIEALLNAMEDDDSLFNEDVENALDEIELADTDIQCIYSDKLCKSKGGMTRHLRTKHRDMLEDSGKSGEFSRFNCRRITIDTLGLLLNQCLNNIEEDLCQTDEVLAELNSFNLFIRC